MTQGSFRNQAVSSETSVYLLFVILLFVNLGSYFML